MTQRNIITIVSFAILSLVSVIPPLIHGYIYPNLSDDTANHLSVILRMVNGTLPSFEFRYFGYAIIGYPMWFLSKLFNIEIVTLFNWFHCLLPLIIGGVLYFVFSRLINWLTGILSLVIPLFVCGASVYYMYYGIVFNLINVLILYPMLIYFVVKWIIERRIYQFILAIFFAILVGTFHVSGLYLPAIAVFIMVAYLIYDRITKNKVCHRKIVIGVGITVVGIICVLLVPYTRQQIIDGFRALLGITVLETEKSRQMDEIYRSLVPYWYFIKNFLSVFIVIIFAITIWQFKTIKEFLTTQSKIVLFMLVCWCLVLLITAYGRLSTIPFRQQTDLAIVFSVLTLVLAGILVTVNKKYLVVVLILIGIGLYPQFIPSWFQDNSAVKNVDKQAIEYLNSIDSNGYDCSPTISYPIYDLFVKEKYNSDSDVLVVRSESMTQGSDINNPYWDGHGKQSTDGYILEKSYNRDGVGINIYRRQK